MRLIDADALVEKLKRTSAFECVRNSADKNVFEIIAEEPTAYDIEKVVAEVQNVRLPLASQKARIIGIVRKGGVE